LERANRVAFIELVGKTCGERRQPTSGRTFFQGDAMRNRTIWIVLGCIVIVLMLMAGLLPLPGQKDNVTPLTEPAPSGQSRP